MGRTTPTGILLLIARVLRLRNPDSTPIHLLRSMSLTESNARGVRAPLAVAQPLRRDAIQNTTCVGACALHVSVVNGSSWGGISPEAGLSAWGDCGAKAWTRAPGSVNRIWFDAAHHDAALHRAARFFPQILKAASQYRHTLHSPDPR
ncbi:hypothetical protein FB45DRAFT_392653 [Roridomyces roridus]|uniref:Uncharacterized protein n=1 Tax=Roridomyces roridus TaxID=1738132 RepID=A0AAD7FA30_9AGAR|nr:hypothetical protein FB45DRAFT_392653 [Roridomyces roridus]